MIATVFQMPNKLGFQCMYLFVVFEILTYSFYPIVETN